MAVTQNPGLRLSTIVLAGLALSVGWGVRGNFGHEFGAMLPGALAAIAVCLMSGREDWRRRVAYFAFFGALGWAFGGSISYGQVLGYAHSGQIASQLYGYAMLFVIGFAWGGMGGAGTAFPAVVDRKRLELAIVPLLWVFGFWWLWEFFGGALIDRWVSSGADSNWQRHLDPLYWFDADDWVHAFTALVAVCLYALFHESVLRLSPTLHGAILGAFGGFFIQYYASFHWFWLMPLTAIIGTIAFGIWRNDYDASLALSVIIGAFAFMGWTLAYQLDLTIDHWFCEAGVVAAIVVFLAWERRMNVLTFVIALVAGEFIAWWLGFRWSLDYTSALGLLGYIAIYSIFVLLLATPPSRAHGFAAMALGGAIVGWAVQRLGAWSGLGAWIQSATNAVFGVFGSTGPFPRHLGDASLFATDPASLTEAQRRIVDLYHGDVLAFQADAFTNWPTFFSYDEIGHSLGWGIGLLLGAAVFLYWYGRFDFGARLYVYMCVGWFVGFLLFPVLLGIRMTPPRSDSWAGTLGLLAGTLVFLFRSGLAPVVYASLITAIIGGVGFSGATFLKLMMGRLGNPRVETEPEIIERWSHYQHANWHSFLEQTYGFINGIGMAIAIAFLATKARWLPEEKPERRWVGPFAVGFTLLFVIFVNWRKAVETWVDYKAVPETMRMFWLRSVELTTQQWFAIAFWTAGLAGIVILALQSRRPLAILPATWLGRGQSLFLVFLWVIVVFNFERALTGFNEQRLITEWMVIVNAAIASVLIILCARDRDEDAIAPRQTRPVPYVSLLAVAVIIMITTALAQTLITQVVYTGAKTDEALLGNRPQYRFGDDAEWRIRPILKSEEHR